MDSPILNAYRERVPAARDLSDEALAEELRANFYPDADPEQFKANVGVTREIGERKIDQYRARVPASWGLSDEELVQELHSNFGGSQPLEDYAQDFGVNFGTGAEESGRPELMTPLVNEPNNPEGRRFPDKGRPERVDAPSSSNAESQQDVGRVDSLSQAGAQTQNQTPLGNEGPGFRINEPDLGPTGRDFSLTREQGIAGTGTFEAADGSSLIGAPMGVDQNIDQAAQTAYQMQGRGERSADDLRRGVARFQSANKAIQLVSSVSNILNANERMERRDDQFIDNRNRLAGGNANVDPEFSQFVDRRGYPTRSEALVAQEREDRETLEREQQRAQELAGELAEIQARRDELGENVTLRRALESGDVDAFLGQLSENPLDVMSGLVLESLPAMTPALGAGVAGGLTAGPVGAAVGVGTVSAITEGILTIQEKLQEYGADLSDPDSVQQVWSENSDEILADAGTRGIVIGAFDAASGGIASKPILAAREGASTASRLARGTADFTARTATQGGLGSAGEASAQLATEGEISSPAEVIAEGVAEFGFAPVEVASLSAASARRRLSGAGDASDLRTQMLNEGYTEVGDGTLRRGDVIVEIDGDEARARLAQRDDPRQPTEPAPEPTEEAPAPAPVQPAQETPDQALDAVIDNASPPADLPDVQTSLEALNRRIQQREQELRSAGVPDDQIQSEQTIVSLRQQAQSLANVDRQTRSQQAEQNANNAIDSERAPTDDALGLQVQSIRQEAQTRSPLRDEIQRLRERASAPAAEQQIDPAQAPNLAPAPEQPDQPTASPQPFVEPTVRANGQPFSTQASVRRSAPFRNATNPEIVPIGEGFGVIDRGESGASLNSFPRLENAESNRPAPAPPINNPATGEFTPERVPTQNIEIDPDTYQFRDDVNRDGVDDRLEGITRFDDLRAGTIILHERNDGRTFVADGHHRIDLARRLGRDSINAIVLRESDGFSTADARRFAAERNVSEGNATPIDAAKVFREYGGDPSAVAEDRDLPRRSQVVRDGAAIAQLSDDAFGAVLNEQITEKDAASIGRNFTDADQQLAAVEQFQRVRPANDRQREILADEIRRAGFSQGEQGGLFGDDPAESLITERVQVKDATQRRLSRRSSLFRTLNENAGAAERAGNQIARDQNSAIQQNAAIAADLVRRADTTPELNQAINQAAQRVKDGEPIGRVAGELEERIVNEAQRLGSTPQGLASDSSLGPADQAGQDARGGESIPPADTGRDGEGREQRLPREESELLTQPTPEDLQARDQAEADRQAAQREADQRADADAQRDDFTLTGSNTEADQAAARGQDSLFETAPSYAVGPETPVTALNGATQVELDGVIRPAINSQGLPIHPTVEGVRNFWRWFGESQAVDAQGRPLVLYHGTASSFESFGKEYLGQSTRATSAEEAFFFSDNQEVAESYAEYSANDARVARLIDESNRAQDAGDFDRAEALVIQAEDLDASLRAGEDRAQGQTILPVYVRVANPLVRDAEGEVPVGLDQSISSMIQTAQRRGNDGVIIRNLDDAVGRINLEADHFAVFAPEDIKSAVGNQGTFSQTNNSIVREPSNEQAIQGDLFTLAGADNVTQRAPDSAFNVDGATEVLSSPTGQFGTVTSTRRTNTYSLPDKPILTAADAATATAQVRKNAQENLVALVTDSSGNVLDLIRHSVGDIASASANNAVIAGSVLRVPGAANVWLSHNHPGGVSSLSNADVVTYDAIRELTEGSGINARGILAIGDTRYSSRASGEASVNEAEIPPARRTRRISVSERTLQRRAKLGEQVSNPSSAIKTAKELGGTESGIVLLNNRNTPVAWVPVSLDEMAAMRGNGVLDRVLLSIERSNSTSVIISTGEGSLKNSSNQKAIANMQRFFADARVKVLDSVSVQQELALSESPVTASDVESYKPKVFFSRAQSDVAGLSAIDATRHASQLMQSWKIAPRVEVVQSVSELPEIARRKIAQSDGSDPVRGVFHEGRVHVIADNVDSFAEVDEVILHEVIGHFGLRNVLGDSINQTLDEVYSAISEADIQSIASRRKLDLSKDAERREAVEEYLADLAQADPQARIIDRIVRLIAEWARSMGMRLNMTNAEIKELMIRAKRFVRDGEIVRGRPIGGQMVGGVAMPAVGDDPTVRFSFAGTRSQTADLGSLEKAKSLQGSNASAEVIRQQTGWFVGVDGQWRYEITDDGASLIESDQPSISEILEEIGYQIEVYQTVPGWYGATTQTDQFVLEGLGRTEQEAREDAARRIAELRGGPSGIRTEQAGKSYRLDQILDHEKLYSAYPDLGGLIVKAKNLDSARGRYNPGNDIIEMNATPERDAFLSTLLHEVQHAIQHREGFATGGTSNVEFWQSVKSGIQELDTSVRNRVLGWQFENQELLDQSERASFNATMGLAYQSAQRLRDYASRSEPSGVFRLIRKEAQWIYEPTFDRLDEGRRIQGEFFNIPNRGPRRNEAISRLAYDAAELIESQIPDELLSEFRADTRKLDNMVRALRRNADRARDDLRELTNLQREARRARNLRESNNLSSPYDTYRAIAGEIEARNTQARQSMTAEERARLSAEATQDVPIEEAIVIVGGAELRVPQTSLDNREEATAIRFSRRGVREANARKESTAASNRNGFPVKFRNDAAKETTVYVAKDQNGNWIEMTTSDPALREQNALKAAMKRWFTKEGQLTDRAYELHTQMIGQRNANEIDISGFTADFLQSVSRTYGKSYQRLADSEKELLNNYLAGVDVQVPEAVKAELDIMRGMLDNLSTRTQMMLIDEVKYILQDMDPDQSAKTAELIRRAKNGDQDAITEIRETSPNGNLIARKLRTFLAVEANKGGYLHRSYRAFDDPSWKNNVPEAVSRRAKSYLRDRIRRDPSMQNLSARAIDDRVDGIVNAILNSNSSDMVDFLSQSQLGEKDLSVLKQRDNIPEPIRDLMGEYKDPRVNFSRTMSQMSTLVASHHFLRSVREEGLGSFLSKEASGRMSQEITSFNEEKLLPLAGLYTTPEFRKALIDFANGNNLKGFMKHVVRVTSSVKYGKTVLSPTTMMRNFYSASMFTVMNGHFGYSNMLKAAQTTWADIRGNTKSRRDYMRRLAQLGVIHDSARAGEISAALDDVMDLDTTRGSAPARAAKETLNIATRMYQAGDDFWKIVGYETEVKDLTDTGMSREDAELLAAKRVRDGYPTYSMVPEAIQLLRRFPLAGTFVSFPWEVMRTSFNQIRMVQEDARAGRNAKAMRRLAGMAIAYSSGYAIKSATMALFGIDDEEDEAVRKLAAPWQMNSQFAYLGNDGEGNMRYLDISHLDPYNHLKRPITALMNGNYDNLGEGAIEGMKEFLAPYFGTDITAGVIGEIWANKKQSSGTSVYDENADRITQGIQAGTHLFDTLRPGVALNVERIFKAYNEQMTTYGREYTLEDELMALIGFRLTTADPKISMQFKSFDFRDQRSAAGRPTYRVLRDPNVVSDQEMRNGVESTYSRWQEGFEDMHAVVRAGRVAGMSDEEIVSSLEKGGVPKRDIAFIIRERVPPWSPSNQSIENAINSVLQYNDTPEIREDLKERFRAMRRAVIDERRKLNEEQADQ